MRAALGYDNSDVAACGVLCFTRAELPLLRTPRIRSHLLLYRKGLPRRHDHDGPLSANVVEQIARELAESLRPA